MFDLEMLLAERLTPAFASVAGGVTDPLIQRSAVADFQANGALALARRLGRPPRDIAAQVLAAADLDGLAVGAVSGPGFINLTIETGAIQRLLSAMAVDERLGVPVARQVETVVVDYSSPNVAKEMHVGNLRSTIIGDALVRVLRLVGHDVRRVNHLGDWGTPFGMLIEQMIDTDEAARADHTIADLDVLYKLARSRFDAEPDFADRARQRVVALQAGEPRTLELWHLLVRESERAFNEIYRRLDVTLTDEDFVGESFYNPRLAEVAEDLERASLLVESGGAACVFPPGFTGRDGQPFPIIVRKNDGGFGYQATDLAAIRYRATELNGTRLLYVVGSPQHQHLQMVFAVARQAGWIGDECRTEHVAFGSILGTDGKMLRSRAGRPVKLIELLDEAVARAAAVVDASSPHLGPAERAAVAEAVGIGAVKYADLSSDMIKDYVFDLDRMLHLHGDTGTYLQYTHARIRSILRKAVAEPGGPIQLQEPAERALALQLLGFGAAVTAVAEQLEPHRLAGHLRGLAVAYTEFYESCPVLRAQPEIRASRLALCDVTGRVLALGLDLLGIQAPERM